jgi:hypothetical protein
MNCKACSQELPNEHVITGDGSFCSYDCVEDFIEAKPFVAVMTEVMCHEGEEFVGSPQPA